MTITLTPRETARLIVDRANALQELVNQKCAPKHRDSWRDALRTLEDRVWEAVNHLDDITDLRSPGDATEGVAQPLHEDATSFPKTASEVEAETERLVRNAQEYQQTARRVLKEVR